MVARSNDQELPEEPSGPEEIERLKFDNRRSNTFSEMEKQNAQILSDLKERFFRLHVCAICENIEDHYTEEWFVYDQDEGNMTAYIHDEDCIYTSHPREARGLLEIIHIPDGDPVFSSEDKPQVVGKVIEALAEQQRFFTNGDCCTQRAIQQKAEKILSEACGVAASAFSSAKEKKQLRESIDNFDNALTTAQKATI